MNITTNPLNSRNYSDINRALGLLNEACIELDRAERAGFPVDEQRAVCTYYRELFNKTKKEYFADKP